MTISIYPIPQKYATYPRGPRAACRAFLAEAAERRGLTLDHLKSRDRTQRIAMIRQHAMAEAYATGKWSLLTIGHCIERDHTTVLHAVKKVRALAQQERAA